MLAAQMVCVHEAAMNLLGVMSNGPATLDVASLRLAAAIAPTTKQCSRVAVPTRTGRAKRSTGTSRKPTAKAIERMLVDLGPNGQRAWDLLDRVEASTLSLADLFDAWSHQVLAGLGDRLAAAG